MTDKTVKAIESILSKDDRVELIPMPNGKEEFIMTFTFAHNNFNVRDLSRSLAFYKEALGLTEVRRKEAEDGSFIIAFLGDAVGSVHQLELTWLRDWDRPYNLGDNEFHLAFHVDDYEAAHALHEKMGCICYENQNMGIYFINDPDNYWVEIVPAKR